MWRYWSCLFLPLDVVLGFVLEFLFEFLFGFLLWFLLWSLLWFHEHFVGLLRALCRSIQSTVAPGTACGQCIHFQLLRPFLFSCSFLLLLDDTSLTRKVGILPIGRRFSLCCLLFLQACYMLPHVAFLASNHQLAIILVYHRGSCLY